MIALMLGYSPRPYSLAITLLVAGCLLVLGAGAVLVLAKLGHTLTVSRPQLVLGALFVISAGVSVAASPLPIGTLPRSVLYPAVATLIAAVYLLHRDRGRVPLVGYFTVIAAVHVPFVLHAMADVWSWHGDFESEIGVFANLRHFGTAGALAAMAATSASVLSRRPWVSLSLAVPALFGVVASGSRAALVAWVLFVGCVAVWHRRRRELLVHAAWSLGTAGVAVLALDRSGILQSPNLFRRVSAAVSGQTEDLGSGRLGLWSEAGGQIAAQPWFGRGPDAFLLSECCIVAHPHNLILSTLAEFGIVGCILLVLLLGSMIVRVGACSLVRSGLSTPAVRVLSAMLLALFALSLVSGSAYWVFSIVNLAVLCGLWMAVVKHAVATRPDLTRDNLPQRVSGN